MSYCPNVPYIQTLTDKFSNFTSCRVSKSVTPGQSTCSFTVVNTPGSTDNVTLTFPTIVSVHDQNGNKVFAGYAQEATFKVEADGSETISVQFPSFDGYFGKLKVVKNYQAQEPTGITDHAYNVLVQGDGFDPDQVFAACHFAPGSDDTEFLYEATEVYAEEALNQLCESTDKRWFMDYGDWTDIDQLRLWSTGSGGNICNLHIVDAIGGVGFAPLNVTLPFNQPICPPQSFYWNVSYTVNWKDVISKVIVVGKGGDLIAGNIGVKPIETVKDIPANSQAKHFPLAPFCILVQQVEIAAT